MKARRFPLWAGLLLAALVLGGLAGLAVFYARLPENLSQHETLVLGQSRWAPGSEALSNAVAFLAFLQATALVLNLLPVPGFDGYGAVRAFLPRAVRLAVRPVEPLAPLALLGLLFFVPAVSQAFFSAAFGLTDMLGLPEGPIIAGLHSFQFWK